MPKATPSRRGGLDLTRCDTLMETRHGHPETNSFYLETDGLETDSFNVGKAQPAKCYILDGFRRST